VVNIWAPARAHGLALTRGLVLTGLKPVAAVLALLPILVVADGYAGVVSLTLLMMFTLGRRLAGLSRKLAGRWGGVEIPAPYLPRPALQQVEHGWYWTGYDYHHSRWVAKASLYTNWFFRDPATWRDLLWLLVDPVVGGVFALAPAALVAYGLASAVLPWLPGEGADLAPGLESTDHVRGPRQAQEPEGGRGERGGVPLVADHDPVDVVRGGFLDAVRAQRVEPPLQVVALDDDGPRDLAVGGPLELRSRSTSRAPRCAA
jgi:hypothetical protein